MSADLHPVVDAARGLLDLVDPAARPSRRERMLALAFAGAIGADCRRRRVCAIIYDLDDGVVITTGYNGRAAGLPGCASAGACPRGQMSYDQVPAGVNGASYAPGGPGECDGVHAEVNACLRSGRAPRNHRWGMAVTDEPCPFTCRPIVKATGIVEVVWPGGLWTP